MADCIIKSGGGSTPDGLTAVASLVYPGKTYVGSDTDGDVGTGTMATKAAATYYATTATQTVPAKDTYMDGEQVLAPVTQTGLSAGNVKAGVNVEVKAGSDVIHSASGAFTSDLTAVATQIYSGKVAYVNGSRIEGKMPLKAASTHYATSVSQTAVPANTYLTGNQTLAAISNTGLVASNIKSGVEVKISNGSANIWTPVTGTFSRGCDAVEANIYSGKTGYKNGTKITGQMPTKAASTYYATASTQVAVAANTYVTGNQTLAALFHSNLAASNIKSGVTITVKNGSATVWNPTGSFTSGVTAAASNVYTGAICYINGERKTGTMATKAASIHYAASSAVTAVAANTYVTGQQTLAALTQSNLSAANIKTGTVVTINNGSANVWTPVTGTFTSGGDATETLIYSGKIAYVNGSKLTGKMPLQGASTITPGTANKTIASGRYLTGNQTIKGYSTLVATNIVTGVTIWGVSGSMLRPNTNQTLYNGNTFFGYLRNGFYINSDYVYANTASYLVNGNDNRNARFTSGELFTRKNGGTAHEGHYFDVGEGSIYWKVLSYNSVDFSKFSKLRIKGYKYANVHHGRGKYAWASMVLHVHCKSNSSKYNQTLFSANNTLISNLEAYYYDGDHQYDATDAGYYDVTFDISSWTATQGFLGICSQMSLTSSVSGTDSSIYCYWQFTITEIYLTN